MIKSYAISEKNTNCKNTWTYTREKELPHSKCQRIVECFFAMKQTWQALKKIGGGLPSSWGCEPSVTNIIDFCSWSLTKRQNKPECLFLASFFKVVSYLRVRPESSRVEHLTGPLFVDRFLALHRNNIQAWKNARDNLITVTFCTKFILNYLV